MSRRSDQETDDALRTCNDPPDTVTSFGNLDQALIQRFAIGTRVEKWFELEDDNKAQLFCGSVAAFEEFDQNDNTRVWGYLIHYEDGDQEHMMEDDVAEYVTKNKQKRARQSQTNSFKRCKESNVPRENGERSLVVGEIRTVPQEVGIQIEEMLECDEGPFVGEKVCV